MPNDDLLKGSGAMLMVACILLGAILGGALVFMPKYGGIVHVSIEAEKERYRPGEQVNITMHAETTLFPFSLDEMDSTYGLKLIKVPDRRAAEEIVNGSNPMAYASQPYGLVHLRMDSSTSTYALAWNQTVLAYNKLDRTPDDHLNRHYAAPAGYYVACHEIGHSQVGDTTLIFRSAPRAIIYIEGVGAEHNWIYDESAAVLNTTLTLSDQLSGTEAIDCTVTFGVWYNGSMVYSASRSIALSGTSVQNFTVPLTVEREGIELYYLIGTRFGEYSVSNWSLELEGKLRGF